MCTFYQKIVVFTVYVYNPKVHNLPVYGLHTGGGQYYSSLNNYKRPQGAQEVSNVHQLQCTYLYVATLHRCSFGTYRPAQRTRSVGRE